MNQKKQREQTWIIRFFLGMSIALYLAFGIFHIGKFITADEHFWVQDRIDKYWNALAKQKWSKTYINDKPGVTLAYVSGIPANIQQSDFGKAVFSQQADNDAGDPKNFGSKYAIYRTPLILWHAIFALFFFWLLRKMLDDPWTALWATILIMLSPILLGISQIVNPDALLWSFSAASFFSFFTFLKTEEKKFAIFAGVFLGLSLLSKYTSVIYMPFFFLMSAFFFYANFSAWKKQSFDISRKILKLTVGYLASIGVSLLVFAILLPASFTKKGVFFKGTIGYPGMEIILWPILALQALLILEALIFKSKISIAIAEKTVFLWEKYSRLLFFVPIIIFILVLTNWMTNQSFFDISQLGFSDKQDTMYDATNATKLQKIMAEFYPLVFSITPLTLISLLFLWGKSTFKKTSQSVLTFSVTFFMLMFYAALIRKNVMATIRYSIMLYPLLSLLAAIGIREFFLLKKNKINTFICSNRRSAARQPCQSLAYQAILFQLCQQFASKKIHHNDCLGIWRI